MEKFVCTHCGHHFEKDSRETVICPNCSWSTSVKKEAGQKDQVVSPTPTAPIEDTMDQSSKKPWLWLSWILFVILLIGVSFFAIQQLKKQEDLLKKIKSKNAEVIATQAPELGLSEEEREILNRRVSVSPDRPLSEEEKSILAPRVTLHSRLPQGVAIPPLDQRHFEAFLKEIELQYKIPLDRSYRKKLVKLFQVHYLPAAQAFEAKNYLKARDEWIRSLIFPIYRNNIEKHHGVMLTMLRSYINDTLSKIGAMNASLAGEALYGGEQKIHSGYQTLGELIERGSWEEANALLLELSKLLEELEKAPQPTSPPALPKEIASVDPDIRDVLLAQVNPVESSVPDVANLRQDLAAKEKVIQSRLPEAVEVILKQYEEALGHIQSGNWAAAKEILQKIDFPAELAQDALKKLEILDKLTSPSLDSEKDSG